MNNRLLALLILLLTLAACSSTKFGYRFLDDLMRWQINKYLVLEADQSRELNQKLDVFHAWHRKTQLPLYSQFLEQQITLLERPAITTQQLNNAMQQAMNLMRNSMRQLVPEATTILGGLNDHQVEKLLSNYDEKSAEYQRERIKPDVETRRKDRIKRMRKSLTRWIGTPNSEQEQLINTWANELNAETGPRLAQRQWFRKQFDTLLAQRANHRALQGQLNKMMVYPDQQFLPAYQNYQNANRQRTLKLLVAIHSSLTPKQKQQMLQKLRDYQADFTEASKG